MTPEKILEATKQASLSRDSLLSIYNAEDIEQLRVQLAGCGVAAMQNTQDSKAQRAVKGDYGYSESYAEVCRAVDREIAHRENAADLEAKLMFERGVYEKRIAELELAAQQGLDALEAMERDSPMDFYYENAIAALREVLGEKK